MPQPESRHTTSDGSPERGDEMIDIERQIVAAGFLAGFDQDHATRARNILIGKRQQRGDRGIDRIAVIGRATAIKPVAIAARLPRTEAFEPAFHFRLLVEMAVEQNAIVVLVAGQVDEDERRAAFEANDFQLAPFERCDLLARPVLHQRHGLIHVAMLGPFGIEGGRLVGDADVIGDRGEDRIRPTALSQNVLSLFVSIIAKAPLRAAEGC